MHAAVFTSTISLRPIPEAPLLAVVSHQSSPASFLFRIGSGSVVTPSWKLLTDLFTQVRHAEGSLKAVACLAGAMGVLWFRTQHRQLFKLRLFQKYIAAAGTSAADILFHM